jgi:hypothetical protein
VRGAVAHWDVSEHGGSRRNGTVRSFWSRWWSSASLESLQSLHERQQTGGRCHHLMALAVAGELGNEDQRLGAKTAAMTVQALPG